MFYFYEIYEVNYEENGKLIIKNSTISGNSADYGGGIYDKNNVLQLYNSIVSLNYTKDIGRNIVSSSYSGKNNIVGGNPYFVNPPDYVEGKLWNAATLDLHLRSDSAAIDEGDNDLVEGSFDRDGKSRIYKDTVDIGAYEYDGVRDILNESFPFIIESGAFVVTTLDSSEFNLADKNWSLQELVYCAPENARITFAEDLEGTIELYETLILDRSLTIDGDGRITLDVKRRGRAILVETGTKEQHVVLKGLSITGGYVDTNTGFYANADGGGIFNNYGTLTVENSQIYRNHAQYGGGIASLGSLTLINSAIWENYASYGGGIWGEGDVVITNATITGNTGWLAGGGIISDDTLVEIDNSIITMNYSDYGKSNIEAVYEGSNNFFDYNPMFVSGPVVYPGLYEGYDDDYWYYYPQDYYDSYDPYETTRSPLDLRLRSDSPIVDENGNVTIGAYNETVPSSSFSYSSVVDTLNDSFDLTDGEWSLREALFWATEYTTITFADGLEGSILLRGSLLIDKTLSIDGKNKITLDANKRSGVIKVSAGTEETPVILKGLTFTNGTYEGGITNFGVLTVEDSTVTQNSSYDIYRPGGGIYNSGTMTIKNTLITYNFSGTDGGGIYNCGTMTIINSQISGNTSEPDESILNPDGSTPDYGYGGGIASYGYGQLTITNSLISDNSSKYGGGIDYYSYSYGMDGGLMITNCTIAGNRADSGGGISAGYSYYGDDSGLAIYNSIIACNVAEDGNNDVFLIQEIMEGELPKYFMKGCNNLSSYTEWDAESSANNYEYDPRLPLFITKKDYQLSENSQAFNKGANRYAYAAGMDKSWLDLAGKNRIIGRIDLGAYEYQYEPSSTISSIMVLQKDSNDYTQENATNEIPTSIETISDWDSFYGEIWSEGMNEHEPGSSVSVEVTYNPKLFTIEGLRNVPEGIEGTITGTDGSIMVEFAVGENLFMANGANTFWGSIYFTPTQTEGSGVSDLTKPESVGISVNNQDVLETKVEALPYDMNQDHSIDIDDLIAFARLFGNSTEKDKDSVLADYNKDGQVDIDDLILFAQNFGRTKGTTGIVMPETRNNKLAQVQEIGGGEPLAVTEIPVATQPVTLVTEPTRVSVVPTVVSLEPSHLKEEGITVTFLDHMLESFASSPMTTSVVDEVFTEEEGVLSLFTPSATDPTATLFSNDPWEWKKLRIY
ncbi:MAG: choice-of-anchor Q domain-containing protein [Planctomycetia bacterium]|nr:choice-of-anchor Q domain-containing protein [Planctomycetia bacterium]